MKYDIRDRNANNRPVYVLKFKKNNNYLHFPEPSDLFILLNIYINLTGYKKRKCR